MTSAADGTARNLNSNANLAALIERKVTEFAGQAREARHLHSDIRRHLESASQSFLTLPLRWLKEPTVDDLEHLPLSDWGEWALSLSQFSWLGPTSRVLRELSQLTETRMSVRMAGLRAFLSNPAIEHHAEWNRAEELNVFETEIENLDRVNQWADRERVIALAREQEEAVEASRRSAQEAKDAADSAQAAAGKTASINLHQEMADFADTEGKRTARFRIAGISCFAAAAAISAYATYNLNEIEFWPTELARLALTVPFIVLAAYFLREAGHARHEAVAARRYAVRLRVIRAYVAELSETQRQEILTVFGHQLFVTSAAPVPGNKEDSDDVVKQLQACAEVLKSARG